MTFPFQGKSRVPRKAPESPRESPKVDFFGKGGSLAPPELMRKFRGASSAIPGTTRLMTTKEKENLAKRFSYGKHGTGYGRDDARKIIEELKAEKGKAKTYEEKLKIDQGARWFKRTTDTS